MINSWICFYSAGSKMYICNFETDVDKELNVCCKVKKLPYAIFISDKCGIDVLEKQGILYLFVSYLYYNHNIMKSSDVASKKMKSSAVNILLILSHD